MNAVRRHDLERDPMEREAWIIDAVRSPRGKGKENGALHPSTRSASWPRCSTRCRHRNGFDTADVDDVVMGCGAGSGDHSMDIARMAALDAGWSLDAPGVTLNRFCGSGQQAVNFAAMGVLAGFQDLVVGGGVESMSRPAPLHVDGFTANNHHLRDQYDMVAQGISADLIATRRGLHAARSATSSPSTARTAPQAAIAEGRFDRALVPIYHDDGTLALDHDEFPRPGTTLESLAKLDAELREDGRRTCPTARAAPSTRPRCWPTRSSTRSATCTTPATRRAWSTAPSAVLVASPDYAKAHGLTPRAKIVMTRGRRHRAGHHAHRARTGRHAVRREGRHDASTTST